MAAVLDWLVFGFIWALTGGAECVLGHTFILAGSCGFTKPSLCAYRNGETFTDSFANYTNTMLPAVILLPQLNLNIFLNPF